MFISVRLVSTREAQNFPGGFRNLLNRIPLTVVVHLCAYVTQPGSVPPW
jgi:hypothetical protein